MVTLGIVWKLLCSASALMMTAPGLALYYGGLVRRKNVLSMQIQCLYSMGLISCCWGIWGYSLALGAGNRWIGGLSRVGLCGLQLDPASADASVPAELGQVIFYGSIAVFAGTLMCGAFAERLKITALTMIIVLWMTLIFCPLSRWVWGTGLLRGDQALLGGVTDFAGGTVVHLSAGISALACALIMGQRLGYGMEDMRPHNLTYAVVGASVLWVGSLFLHAGQANLHDARLLNAALFTGLTVASGAVSWPILEWLQSGKASALGAASGIIAGVACASSGCGLVSVCYSPLFGILATLGCYATCRALATVKAFDDCLDVFSLHAVAAVVGLVLTAGLASPNLVMGSPGLLYHGGFRILAGQLCAIAVVVIWVGLASTLIFKLVDVVVGLRVSRENEMLGLDVAQHGQEGYILSNK
jgi:Amt family ammonium transporter